MCRSENAATDPHKAGQRLLAERLVESRHHGFHIRIADPVVYRLPLATRLNHLRFAKFRQMLAERRLAESDRILKNADRPFSARQFAQDQQPLRVRHQRKSRRNVVRTRLKLVDFWLLAQFHYISLD